jgi:hypothetical protein
MYIAYGLLTKGLYYRFIMGDNHPPAMREISCAGSGINVIFARDCSENSWPAVETMMVRSIPKGDLADIGTKAP